MKALIASAVAVFCIFASGAARAQAFDPTAPGPFAVSTAQYNHGSTAFTCPASAGCCVSSSEILAEVYYPTNLPGGPFPLIVFLHGRHAPCYNPSTGLSDFNWNNGCISPDVMVPSYRGYDYIGRNLASHGYIVASISANGINAQDNAFQCRPALGANDRAFLVDAHLGLWNTFNTAGSPSDGAPFASSFIGKVDLRRVGTMGHSRGGDGVVRHFSLFAGTAPYTVRAVLPIAPTNFIGTVINNVNLGVLLGYCDGDISTLEGLLYFDRARYLVPGDQSFKYTFLALGGNHNFFNSVWTPDCWQNQGTCWTDARGAMPSPATVDDYLANGVLPTNDPFCGPTVPGNGRLTGAQQRQVGLAYAAAFFRTNVAADADFSALLRGDLAPPPTVDPRVYVGFLPPAARRLDLNRLNDASELTQTTLIGIGGVHGAVTNNNLITYQRCGFDIADPCFTVGFREAHLSQDIPANVTLSRLRTAWNTTSGTFANAIPPGVRDVRRFDELQFRVGVDFTDQHNPTANPQQFTVALSDGTNTVSANTNSQLGVNDLYFPPGDPTITATAVMSTLRLPLGLFSGINLGDVRSVTFNYNQNPAGTILVSDLSFVADERARQLCQASDKFIVDAQGSVTTPGGGFAVLNSGSAQTLIGFNASTDGILSVAPVQVLSGAAVSSDIVSSGAVSVASSATVGGTVSPFTPVSLPAVPALPAFPAPTGTVNPNPINSGVRVTLPNPGSYPSVTINSGGMLVLSSGTYFFTDLTINSASTIQVAPDTRILVKNTFAYRSPFVNSSKTLQPIFLGFAGTSAAMEAQFNGTLVAPNASMAFGNGSGLVFTGSFLAKDIDVRSRSALVCSAGPTGPTGSQTPTCTDGIKNGQETGVDCGGPVCPACPAGQGCKTGSDCVTGICTGGICQPPPGSVMARTVVSADWSFGYCVTLFVSNNTMLPTKNWSVTLDTRQSTIYTSWNGNFSGSSGVLTVMPEFDWNHAIAPGATDGSVGFCANRAVPGSGVLPSVLSASGTF